MPDQDYVDATGQMRPTFGSRPIPDPTLLTTQQLLREISSLKELIETRLDGMDKAIVLLQTHADKLPGIDEVVARFDERFVGIDNQFKNKDVALNAALQAAEKAVGKSSDAFTKQIDNIVTLIQTGAKSNDDKIEDIKQRMTALDSDLKVRIASIEQRGKGMSELWGYLGIAAGLVIAFLTFLLKH